MNYFSCVFALLLSAQGRQAWAEPPRPSADTSGAVVAPLVDEPMSIDDRFSTEGYAGLYAAALQSSVPALGLTGSIYLAEDLRAGMDLWRGQSKGLFSSFRTQGGGLWTAWELDGSVWLKGGLSYFRLDRPTAQEPMSALLNSKDTTAPQAVRSDSIQIDLSVGQLWSLENFSLSADYVGFSVPFVTLTGPKQSMFNVHALRIEVLYDID
jgi:hypothetical protein